MPIASEQYFTRAHIEASRKSAPADLAELALHSLELVAQLVRQGLRFRFKGGNSLLVLLEDPRRFSIDVDISTDETRERIDECLDKAKQQHGVFSRWRRRQHKTKPWLPMTSYEIFFRSHFAEGGEAFVMLDAVLHNSLYETVKRQVKCGSLYQSGEFCEVPSVSALLGDKILTLGPRTLGIPTGKGKEAQRLKHVHDVALLASHAPVLEKMRESVRLCLEQENRMQEKSLLLGEVLEDTLLLCRLPSLFPAVPKTGRKDPVLDEITRGLNPFSSHLFSNDYSWERLQVDSAKVALCFAAMACDIVSSEDFDAALAKGQRQTAEARYFWSVVQKWTNKDWLAPQKK